MTTTPTPINRARGGRAPDLDSERSRKRGLKVRTLDPAVTVGAPDFPLVPPQVLRPDGEVNFSASEQLEAIEERIWGRLWSLPQAQGWVAEPWRLDAVAAYTRVAALCETPWCRGSDRSIMVRLADEIALTGTGLARAGWRIGEAEAEAQAPQRPPRRPAKERLGVRLAAG